MDVTRIYSSYYSVPLCCQSCRDDPYTDWSEITDDYRVECTNPKCKTGIKVIANTRKAAVEAWNKAQGPRLKRT